jgi:U6 snRNA-associated Sm-like protein LSm1
MTIRGENVTICATVDLDAEDEPKGLKFVPADVVRRYAAEQKAQKKASEERKAKALKRVGVEANIGMHA